MYRFTRWDSSSLQVIGRNIWWAETYPVFAMNTDNFPLEHLELWHNAPSDAATLFDTMDFIERPSEYADEKYAGAYVFAHAFKQIKSADSSRCRFTLPSISRHPRHVATTPQQGHNNQKYSVICIQKIFRIYK